MSSLPETRVSRLAYRARTPTLLRVTVSERLARFLVAAGARSAPVPADDFMSVDFGASAAWPLAPSRVEQHRRLLGNLSIIERLGFSQATYTSQPDYARSVLQARSIALYFLTSWNQLEKRWFSRKIVAIIGMEDWKDQAGAVSELRLILGDIAYEHFIRSVDGRGRTGPGGRPAGSIGDAIKILQRFLDAALRPADVSGLFLGDLVLLPEDLNGIIWDSATVWAGSELADYARQNSEPVGQRGAFQIRDWQSEPARSGLSR
jgi:hypothetical protein